MGGVFLLCLCVCWRWWILSFAGLQGLFCFVLFSDDLLSAAAVQNESFSKMENIIESSTYPYFVLIFAVHKTSNVKMPIVTTPEEVTTTGYIYTIVSIF